VGNLIAEKSKKEHRFPTPALSGSGSKGYSQEGPFETNLHPQRSSLRIKNLKKNVNMRNV